MSQFAIGLLLIAIAVTGNGETFSEFALENSVSFVKWWLAVYILKWCIFNAPTSAKPATRTFSIGLIIGLILINQSKISSLLKSAAAEFKVPNWYDNGLNTNVKNFSGASYMATEQQQISFLQQNLPYATAAAAQLGTTPETLLAQSAYETGWGTSNVYQQDNNVAGINVVGSQTGEEYQTYSNLQQGWTGYLNTLMAPQYQSAYGQVGTNFANAVNSGGYSTNPNYGSEYSGVYQSVLGLMPQVYSSMTPSPSQTPGY